MNEGGALQDQAHETYRPLQIEEIIVRTDHHHHRRRIKRQSPNPPPLVVGRPLEHLEVEVPPIDVEIHHLPHVYEIKNILDLLSCPKMKKKMTLRIAAAAVAVEVCRQLAKAAVMMMVVTTTTTGLGTTLILMS